MAQFVGDVLERLGEVLDAEGKERLPAGFGRKVFRTLSPSVSLRSLLVEMV